MAHYETKKAKIAIRVTKNFQFQAIVTEHGPDGKTYSVMVGGNEWKTGKLLKYQERIITRCKNIIPILQSRVELARTFTEALVSFRDTETSRFNNHA